MTDREFDHIIKRMLEDYQPDSNPQGWEAFEQRLDQEMLEDTLFDNTIRTSLGAFSAPAGADWERMEEELIREEMTFDAEVKDKVEHYEAPYNPATWPVLDAKISEDERLRRRIIVTKALELVAILIAFITVYNFFPAIQTSVIEPTEQFVRETISPKDEAQAVIDPAEGPVSPDATADAPVQLSLGSDLTAEAGVPAATREDVATTNDVNATSQVRNTPDITESSASGQASPPTELAATDVQEPLQPGDNASGAIVPEHDELRSEAMGNEEIATVQNADARQAMQSLATLAMLDPDVATGPRQPALGIESLVLTPKSGLRFSISTSAELNQLYIPADHFYSLGKQVSFTEKDMTAIGYSAGASILFDREIWTFETGLHYSSKTYHPNRILHIGETFDVRTLDFKNISLSVISVPLQVHWNFDRKGKTRLYTVGGLSMNLIAEAHYDLIVKNNFRSSAAPPDPSFLRTSQEVQRIREHILDDAEFSAKSFLTVNAGFGVERLINHKFSVFVQPTASYQIPFFHISDQNGKHLQYLSAQFGTRIRLR